MESVTLGGQGLDRDTILHEFLIKNYIIEICASSNRRGNRSSDTPEEVKWQVYAK